ncbi:hypothetical protein D3C73_1245180 [compost metagenome]
MLAQQAPDHRNQRIRQSGSPQLILQSGLPAAELAPRCHIQQQSPQTIKIGGRLALPSSILFRSGKPCCPEFFGVFIPAFSKPARDAQINQLQLIAAGQHDIPGLHVAVDNGRMMPVQVLQHIQQLLGITKDSDRRQRPGVRQKIFT